MDISKLSVEALKAMAYDEFVRVQVSQKNLEIINAEISKRQSEVPETTPETVKKDK
jgi:hypothetical protein